MLYHLYLGGDNSKQGKRFPEMEVADVLISQGVCGFTLIPATGYWDKAQEGTWIIEVTSDPGEDIKALAQYLRIFFKQQAIGLVKVGEFQLVQDTVHV